MPGDAADWQRRVLAVEKAYADAAIADRQGIRADRHAPEVADPALAAAIVGAVASRYLAVGTPRSIGLIGDSRRTALSLAAHHVWFQPTDIRCTEPGLDSGRVTSIAEALAADIVCVHAPIAIARTQLRRGTHVNVLAACELDADLAALATVTHETPGLGLLAAGLVDGRQLDELTVFVLGEARVAIAALDRG